MLQQHWRFEEYEWGMVLDDVLLRSVLHVVVVVAAAGGGAVSFSSFSCLIHSNKNAASIFFAPPVTTMCLLRDFCTVDMHLTAAPAPCVSTTEAS